MAGIPSAAESILAVALIGKGLLSRRKSRVDEVLTVLSILLCGAGIVLCILALERFLATLYRPDIAAILTAAAVFSIALLAVLVKQVRNTYGRHAVKNAGSDIEKSLRGMVEPVLQEINEPIRDNPKMAMLIAAIAGFAAIHGRR
ncbi:MAG: hypothetical protein Q8K65_10865 [Alphaproteobacteria bacterium]|nr:hypothetical protein [Alphaproteobacteria bacterium]